MRLTRRLAVFAGLLIVGWGLARLVMPIVVAPDAFAGGMFSGIFGWSDGDGGAGCGTVIDPGPTGVLSGLNRTACEQALDAARVSGIAAMACGTIVVILALALLRDGPERVVATAYDPTLVARPDREPAGPGAVVPSSPPIAGGPTAPDVLPEPTVAPAARATSWGPGRVGRRRER